MKTSFGKHCLKEKWKPVFCEEEMLGYLKGGRVNDDTNSTEKEQF
jgi:hypothetical protein